MARGFDRTATEYLFNASAVVTAVPLTMATWLNTTDLTNTKGLLRIHDGSASNYFGGYVGPSETISFRTAAGGPFSTAITTATISSGTWHHFAGVSPATNSRSVYLDGSNKVTDTNDRTPSGLNRTEIGTIHATANVYDGNLAEAAIWDVALNDSEVAALAKGYSPLLIRPANLVFYLPLIRDNDIDLVGGLSLTANGTPTVENHPRIIYPSIQLWTPPPMAVAGGEGDGGRGIGRGIMRGIGRGV